MYNGNLRRYYESWVRMVTAIKRSIESYLEHDSSRFNLFPRTKYLDNTSINEKAERMTRHAWEKTGLSLWMAIESVNDEYGEQEEKKQ